MSSRRDLPSKIDGYSVIVGWDNPMMTFFAQVERPPIDRHDDDTIVLWLGNAPRQFVRPEDMVAPLAPYADLTAEALAELRADRLEDIDKGPTAFQRATLHLFDRARR